MRGIYHNQGVYIFGPAKMAIATRSDGEGGYEYQFVVTPSDMLVCKICHCPSREPRLTVCCGHTFCSSCLEGAKRATMISDACPVCRNEEFVTVPNKQVDRAVRSLHVFCTNKDKGCEWQGEVNNIVIHLRNSDGCQFEEVPCANNCGNYLQRRYLASHVEDKCVRRRVDCYYCHVIGEHRFIDGEHKEQCPKYPINCPNNCEVENIPREDIDKHRKVCLLEEVTCPNGCGITLQRQYIANHSNIECPQLKVKCQYCYIIGQHQFIENKHKEQCSKLPVLCPNKCKVESVLRENIEKHMKICSLEQVQCEYHMVGCQETLARRDQKEHNREKMEEHLSFAVSALNTTRQELSLTRQNLTRAEKMHNTLAADTLDALSKLEIKFQTKITKIETAAQNRIAELEKKVQQKDELLEMLHGKWTIELVTIAAKLSSGNQVTPVIMKMSEYTKKKRDMADWYSDPFYSHPKGYQMCLCVFPAGNYSGRGTHLSVILYLMNGPYDDQLRWPMVGICEVKLLNQTSNTQHHIGYGKYQSDGCRRVSSGEVSRYPMWYTNQFISNKELHKITTLRQYFKHDSIFFQVDYFYKDDMVFVE